MASTNNITDTNVALGMQFVAHVACEEMMDRVGENSYAAQLKITQLQGAAIGYVEHAREAGVKDNPKIGHRARTAIMFDSQDEVLAEVSRSKELIARTYLVTRVTTFGSTKEPDFFNDSPTAQEFGRIGKALRNTVAFDHENSATRAAKELANEFIENHMPQMRDELDSGKIGPAARSVA